MHGPAVRRNPLQGGQRKTCRGLLFAFACLVLPLPAAAADGPPDPDTVAVWVQMRAALFGDRTVIRDAGTVVSLQAPARAQDAAVVPIAISTHLPQSGERYVRKLYLFIDANPSPLGAIFTFSPESGRADIETRVRVEDYGWMRAVAELSDGTLFSDLRYVKAAGGCSAPAGTTGDFETFTPRARLRVEASTTANRPLLAQLMIQHPNSSGLARDPLTQLYIPPYFVRTVSVTYAGHPVLTADIDFSISENPNLRFYFLPHETGDLKAVAVDTRDRTAESSVTVEIQ